MPSEQTVVNLFGGLGGAESAWEVRIVSEDQLMDSVDEWRELESLLGVSLLEGEEGESDFALDTPTSEGAFEEPAEEVGVKVHDVLASESLEELMGAPYQRFTLSDLIAEFAQLQNEPLRVRVETPPPVLVVAREGVPVSWLRLLVQLFCFVGLTLLLLSLFAPSFAQALGLGFLSRAMRAASWFVVEFVTKLRG
jgi:hypothetical protein